MQTLDSFVQPSTFKSIPQKSTCQERQEEELLKMKTKQDECMVEKKRQAIWLGLNTKTQFSYSYRERNSIKRTRKWSCF